MGLDRIALKMIAPHLKGADVLCLGYPDIVVPPNEVESILACRTVKFTDNGEAHKVAYRLAETISTFKAAGAKSVYCVDIRPSRGCEGVVDLNHAVAWPQRYDLVIDGGTLEHCFNIGQAFVNAWAAVSMGGHIVHVNPLSMVNHGFYNICPTAYVDFYAGNGGALGELVAADRSGALVDAKLTRRHKVPSECVVYAKARKEFDCVSGWPQQTKYRVPE